MYICVCMHTHLLLPLHTPNIHTYIPTHMHTHTITLTHTHAHPHHHPHPHMHTHTVRGAHPQHYHEFMTVLCGYIVEKQREWQGEEIPQELVYVSERGEREEEGM